MKKKIRLKRITIPMINKLQRGGSLIGAIGAFL